MGIFAHHSIHLQTDIGGHGTDLAHVAGPWMMQGLWDEGL